MNSLLEFTYVLSSVDIAADGRAKPSAIANALQEAARAHAHTLGWGVETLHKKKKYWVLSRARVQWTERPKHGLMLKIVTWPKGFSGRFALRDFEVWHSSARIAVGTTSWALIDLKQGRPASFDELPDLFLERKDQHAIENPAEKVDARTPGTPVRKIKPLYTDLDEIGHVNNTRYLDWAWSCISEERRASCSGWTVNYLKEVQEEEEVTIEIIENPTQTTCKGVLSSGKLAFALTFHN